MLHSGEWLAKKYASLSQPKATQTLDTTLSTLASRLQELRKGDGNANLPPLPSLADRKAAVLTLKGLSRDHPVEVGAKAFDAILESLCRDASQDDEIARAAVETCLSLCEATAGAGNAASKDTTTITHKGKEMKLPAYTVRHVERFLSNAQPLHALLPLLSPSRSFYTRFSALQLLGSLLRVRSERVQEHVLTSPGGCGAILECLSDNSGSSAEIVRNEALLLLPQLVAANADIQKLVAFEGAFEKLIDVVAIEGRIEGGVVVQDALEALVALLKYNVSNQNYFRETLSVPLLAPLLFYPPPPPADDLQAQEEYYHQSEAFAFQQWYPPAPMTGDVEEGTKNDEEQETDDQKVINAGLVLDVAKLLVEGQGESKRMNQNALLACGFTKCLVELALACTAPIALRSQSLRILASLLQSNRSNQDLLDTMEVSPVVKIGVPADGDEGQNGDVDYTRLPARPAIQELAGAIVNGAPENTLSSEALAFRAAALGCLDAYVNDNLDARLTLIRSMAGHAEKASEMSQLSVGTGASILRGIAQFPRAASRSFTMDARETFDALRYLLSALAFADLIRGSATAKNLAQGLLFGPDGNVVALVDVQQGQVHHIRNDADGDDDDDDDRVTLIQVLIGNLTMALREHGEATRRERGAGNVGKGQNHGNAGSPSDWTRVQVGYLIVLITWLWESPAAVTELLRESSNLQVLIQPVSQGGNMIDPIVSGLCAVTLGIAYEFGPIEESEGADGSSKEDRDLITRATMHPILHSRIGPDQFAARLTRLRDDSRFKNIGPDILESIGSSPTPQTTLSRAGSVDELDGLWFDWAFVDFLKTNYALIQKSILVDPTTTSASQASQSTELLDAKRQLEQAKEVQGKLLRDVEQMRQTMKEMGLTYSAEKETLRQALESANAECQSVRQEVERLQRTIEEGKGQRQNEDELKSQQTKMWEGRVEQLEQAVAHESSQRVSLEAQLQASMRREEDTAREKHEAQREADSLKAVAAAATKTGGSTVNGNAALVDEGEKSKAELEKELEDLLILLDELSSKRKRDKDRMRERGMEVSEDEDDEDDDDV